MVNLWFVIPAYNEEKSIFKVISSLKKSGYKNIVVVDDGSTDRTSEIAKKCGVKVLKHIFNMGQGAALQTGIDYVLNKGAEFIVTFDADGQHNVEDIPALIKPVVEKKADISFGSRFLGKGNKIPFSRKFLLKGAIFVIWFFYGIKMTDAHNGLRCMNRKAAMAIRITSRGMEHASEIIEQVTKKNINYVEVPVVINYDNIRKGRGGLLEAFRILFKMVWRRLL